MASMIISELKAIIREQIQQGFSNAYVLNSLKEYLQVYVLNYIYTTDQYKQSLIFTGGTCLRHCFGLNRLSEDIDFDQAFPIDIQQLADDLLSYFSKKYQYKDLKISIKQKGRQLLLKFPVLHALELASQSESDLLYVKLDISSIASKKIQTQTTLKNLYGFNYVMKHYSLPDLMSGKIAAVLTRQRLWGESNQATIKVRDYFDLLWFLDKQIIPNLQRINDLIKENLSSKELVDRLNEKVDLATSKFKLDFKRDLLPFVALSETSISDYLESYQSNYLDKVKYLLNV
ncbi:nucleotidyl transferase AbiEii/AbiGii toxin family protein [Microgenomates group bacterium]|nr:nucleotidyl transferase AbiEii/AbiGii toxin family protein [Microgenomates group bacterium]